MIDTVYLDLDDVCNILSPYLFWRLNITREWRCPVDYTNYPCLGTDIIDDANLMLGCTKYDWDSFWDSVSREMWANTPESNEFHSLLSECKHLVGKSRIFIATKVLRSASDGADAAAGKLDWINRHCPPWLRNQFHISTNKEHLARPGALLIDDNEKNCSQFLAGGGSAILVPRPWNQLKDEDTLSSVLTALNKI